MCALLGILAIVVLMCGCSVSRTYSPGAENKVLVNRDGMGLGAGDPIEVLLMDGDTVAGIFAAIDGHMLAIATIAAPLVGGGERILVPLVDVDKITSRKLSTQEKLVGMTGVVPAILVFIVMGTQTGWY